MNQEESIAIENFIDFCDEMQIANEGKIMDWVKSKFKKKPKKDKRSDNSKNTTHDQTENINESERKAVMKKMQSGCVSYLKSYASKPEFKSKYKDFLYLIDIIPENYGDPYSIEICGFQDGLDDEKVYAWMDKHESEYTDENDAWKACPYTKNAWYDELLDAGEAYLKTKYKNEIQKYRMKISTGDGDEGNIYICV